MVWNLLSCIDGITLELCVFIIHPENTLPPPCTVRTAGENPSSPQDSSWGPRLSCRRRACRHSTRPGNTLQFRHEELPHRQPGMCTANCKQSTCSLARGAAPRSGVSLSLGLWPLVYKRHEKPSAQFIVLRKWLWGKIWVFVKGLIICLSSAPSLFDLRGLELKKSYRQTRVSSTPGRALPYLSLLHMVPGGGNGLSSRNGHRYFPQTSGLS